MTRRKTANGRVTPSKRSRKHAMQDVPAATSRYTPPTPAYRLRPSWHRVAGWLTVAVGVFVAVVNDLMLMGDDLTLLPGGHNELYLILGVGISVGATWFLGLFDRGTTVYR